MSTKQNIFDNALSLFSKKGYDGVSIRDIAKAVGIKESSIYNHYPSKKAIIDDICEHFVQTLSVSRPPLAQVEAMLEKIRPSQVFLALISAYGQSVNDKITQMAKVVFSEQYHDNDIHGIFTEEFIKKNVEYYIEILTLMQKKNLIRACDTAVLANVFNNEQIMLTIQFASCENDNERFELAKIMKQSAEYLFLPLEVIM